jgi:pteridine reductase
MNTVNDSRNHALKGKVALITGGGKRVGAAMVRMLHAHGAQVLVHCNRSMTAAEALTAELNAARPDSAAVTRLDLLQIDKLDSLVKEAQRIFGGLDILINNASTFYPTPVGEITLEHWQDLLGSNLQAPLFLSQAAAPLLQQREGLIINIVDIHGVRPLRQYSTYSIAKAGLIMLTKSLARELAPQVRVNGIAPGPVMWPEDGLIDAQAQQKILSRTPLRRAGSPQDIAQAALFFAIDAPYVTGHIMPVDGGRSVGW